MLPDDDKRYAIETCRSSESVLKKWFKINDIQLMRLLVVWWLVNLQDARCNIKDNKEHIFLQHTHLFSGILLPFVFLWFCNEHLSDFLRHRDHGITNFQVKGFNMSAELSWFPFLNPGCCSQSRPQWCQSHDVRVASWSERVIRKNYNVTTIVTTNPFAYYPKNMN